MGASDGTVIGLTQVAGGAPVAKALNIMLLAEGFTAGEQVRFDAAVDEFVTQFLLTSPFDALRPVFNFFRLNVASAESGADDPASAGGSGRMVRTFFDATFGGHGLGRLLVCNKALVLTTASGALREFNLALVVVNSGLHGGSGGQVPVYSLSAHSVEIAMHEIGHSLFGLADEYAFWANPNVPEPDRERHPRAEPPQPNVTTRSDVANMKWRDVLTPGFAVPTMRNPNCTQFDPRPSPVPSGTVGLFEGANNFRCRIFRPEFDCKMRTLGQPFCRVCRDAILRQLTPFLPSA